MLSSNGTRHIHKGTPVNFHPPSACSSMRTDLPWRLPALGGPQASEQRLGSGVEMTSEDLVVTILVSSHQKPPVAAVMRCTATHAKWSRRRRSRPKWSRDPGVLDLGLSGEIPTAILGNDLYTKYQRPQRIGKLGCPLRVGMDIFVRPKERTGKPGVCSRYLHASGSRTLGLVE